jgi:hypothetical protein
MHPISTAKLTEKALARFWAKVDKNGPIPKRYPELGPCWLWIGSVDVNGYGQFSLNGRATGPVKAHRVAWVIKHRKKLISADICHHCDNPPCVSPKHLFKGNAKLNAQDSSRKGRTLNKKKGKPGSRNNSAILTEKDIPEIFRLHKKGLSHRQIGDRFKVDRSTVGLVLSRKHWKHVKIKNYDE